MKRRVSRGFCLVLCGGLPPIGACGLLPGRDTGVDPFAGLVGRDCASPFEAPAADRTWGIGPTPPAISSEDTALFVFGGGASVGAVLFGAGLSGPPEERKACAWDVEEVEFVLEGRRFTLQGTSERADTNCTMDLRGWIAPCANQDFAGPSESFDVIVDGSVVIDGRKLSVHYSQLMMGLQSLEPRPCNEVPTTVDEIEWTLTNTDPLIASESAAGDVDVAVAGLGPEIASAALSPAGDPTRPICHSEAPEGSLSFDGETLRIDVPWLDDGEGCELHFQGRVIECRTPPMLISFADPPMPRVLRIEGEGTYRTSESSGTLSTLFLRVPPYFPVGGGTQAPRLLADHRSKAEMCGLRSWPGG